jgi:glycosyltransferase involved in cell wall biosynthesis
MRLLIINPEFPPVGGGAANASAHLAREFQSLGHATAVLTCRFPDLPTDEIRDGVVIHRVWSLRKSKSRSGPLEQFSFLLGSVTQGVKFVFNWKPDALVCFFGMPSGPVGLLAKALWGIPYVVSLRGGDVPGFRPYDFSTYHKLVGPVLRFIWQKADGVVANSQGLKELAKSFAPKIPIDVIPNGVDVERFRPRDRSWKPARLLFVGRVVYQKGLDLLIRALRDLKELEWELTVVGDGPYLDKLKSLAKNAGIRQRIQFAGWVEKDNILEHYQRANLFVFPSRHEGMPNALLEAMAMGLPAVASDIAGNQELIQSGINGFLFPKESINDFREHLEDLISDASKRKIFGDQSHQVIVQEYSWLSTAEAYLELLSAEEVT